MTEPSSAVVLLSGGMDSSVLMFHVRQTCETVHALSIFYGQRHARELECAGKQTYAAGAAAHELIDLSGVGPLLRAGSVLLEGSGPVPKLEDIPEKDRSQPPTYVPNRNMMLLSVAAAYAEAHGITQLYYGAQAQDEYGYWDCTSAFVERMNSVLALNRAAPVIVHAPFVRYSKTEILRLGLNLGVRFEDTWSCYRGKAPACGVCPTCVERLRAFRALEVDDPIAYEADITTNKG